MDTNGKRSKNNMKFLKTLDNNFNIYWNGQKLLQCYEIDQKNTERPWDGDFIVHEKVAILHPDISVPCDHHVR